MGKGGAVNVADPCCTLVPSNGLEKNTFLRQSGKVKHEMLIRYY